MTDRWNLCIANSAGGRTPAKRGFRKGRYRKTADGRKNYAPRRLMRKTWLCELFDSMEIGQARRYTTRPGLKDRMSALFTLLYSNTLACCDGVYIVVSKLSHVFWLSYSIVYTTLCKLQDGCLAQYIQIDSLSID